MLRKEAAWRQAGLTSPDGVVRPDRTLYAASLQTMPFASPQFSEVLAAVDFVTKNNYPARGEA
jgi:hypothetical protein